MTSTQDSPGSSRRGFTIIELMVVMALIAVLLALLVPALSIAQYSARQTLCLSQMRQQYAAQVAYAMDNEGKFCARTGTNSPDYQRQNGVRGDPVSLLRGRYISNTRIMICPIVANLDSLDWSNYSSNDWALPGYGGWNTNEPNIYCGYMWLAGFNGGGYSLAMLDGEPLPPTTMGEMSPQCTFITHRLNFYSANSLQEPCHGGSGLFVTATPYNNYQCNDMPVCYGDGSALIHHRSDIKPRMTVNGNYPSNPGFPGTYLW